MKLATKSCCPMLCCNACVTIYFLTINIRIISPAPWDIPLVKTIGRNGSYLLFTLLHSSFSSSFILITFLETDLEDDFKFKCCLSSSGRFAIFNNPDKFNSDPLCLAECQTNVGGLEESPLLYTNVAFFGSWFLVVVPMAWFNHFKCSIGIKAHEQRPLAAFKTLLRTKLKRQRSEKAFLTFRRFVQIISINSHCCREQKCEYDDHLKVCLIWNKIYVVHFSSYIISLTVNGYCGLTTLCLSALGLPTHRPCRIFPR